MGGKIYLFVQLGSPETLTKSSVRDFLKQFLMDERVIDIPFFFRFLLVYGIVLNLRPKRTLEKYSKIWDYTSNESPLIKNTRIFIEKLKKEIPNMNFDFAFRYGKPSLKEKLNFYYYQGIRDVHIIPLYPQYSTSTYGSILAKVCKVNSLLNDPLCISFEPPFYDDENFISLWEKKVKNTLTDYKNYYFIFSCHGIPANHIKKSDVFNRCFKDNCCINARQTGSIHYCYRAQCYELSKKLADKLSLEKDQWILAFQSRLGKGKWLEPYLEKVIENLHVDQLVILPLSFVSDCLETLEEVNDYIRKKFMNNSKERKFYFIPSLNYDDEWIAFWKNKWISHL